MGLEEWIEDADAKCARGSALLGFESDVWTRDLSTEEADLLCAAAGTLEVRLLDSGAGLIPVLVAGASQNALPSSEFERARRWDAFVSLCLRGVIAPEGGGKYRMSEVARLKGQQIAAQRFCDRR